MALNFTEVMLIGALINIKEMGPEEKDYGLCWNIEALAEDEAKQVFRHIAKYWPKYSGDDSYPIPGGKEGYVKARMNGTQWDTSTEYGMLRYELLDFCINYLQKKDQGYVLQTAH